MKVDERLVEEVDEGLTKEAKERSTLSLAMSINRLKERGSIGVSFIMTYGFSYDTQEIGSTIDSLPSKW